jgi:hypothetical protein
MVPQSLPVHHGGQFRCTVFSHNADTLHVEAKPTGNNGYVDSLASQINTGIPDSVHLTDLKALNIDSFVKTGIQTN